MKITSREDPKSWGLGFLGPRLLGHFRPPGFQEATPRGPQPRTAGLARADHLEGKGIFNHSLKVKSVLSQVPGTRPLPTSRH